MDWILIVLSLVLTCTLLRGKPLTMVSAISANSVLSVGGGVTLLWKGLVHPPVPLCMMFFTVLSV